MFWGFHARYVAYGIYSKSVDTRMGFQVSLLYLRVMTNTTKLYHAQCDPLGNERWGYFVTRPFCMKETN